MAGSEPIGYIANRFVDEAGDANLFDRRGRVIVGTAGCSRFFILGCASMAQPELIASQLAHLRADLLADAYFKGVPSMQPDQRKTGIHFHAKDDLFEVRREVFRVLQRLVGHIGFTAVVRDKNAVLRGVQERNRTSPDYRYNPNELYDQMVRSPFRNQLLNRLGYRICFASRGSSTRTEALSSALEKAPNDWVRKRCVENETGPCVPPVAITCARTSDSPGLQVADYFLWALQRLYERGEGRFVQLLWPSIGFVWDQDDKRESKAGVWYGADRKKTAGRTKRAGTTIGRILTAAAADRTPGI